MRVTICTLASGSSGNCTYVGLGDIHLLVDLGIGLRRLCRRLSDLEVTPDQLSAVLLTHEHGDHVGGLGPFRDRYPGVPVLCSSGTARYVFAPTQRASDVPCLRAGKEHDLGPVRILPVAVSHDAAQPLGFRLQCGDLAAAVFTDLGVAPRAVAQAVAGCHVLIVESNHDDDMLWAGSYPALLKRRIASPRGHLSNRQAASLLDAAASSELRHVILAHMSAENNDPALAVDEARSALRLHRHVTVVAAPRASAGEPLELNASAGPATPPAAEARQLKLFDADP